MKSEKGSINKITINLCKIILEKGELYFIKFFLIIIYQKCPGEGYSFNYFFLNEQSIRIIPFYLASRENPSLLASLSLLF